MIMKVKVLREFHDVEAGVLRQIGDEFNVTQARFKVLANHPNYGSLVEGVPAIEKKPAQKGETKVIKK